jgi:papain like protease
MKARAGGDTRLFNVETSPDREKDWTPRKQGRLRDEPAPAALDLRAGRPWYTVHDQGQTGSCVGWALAESVLRWQLVEAERLRPRQHLSARFLWMASKEYRAQRMLLGEWEPSTFLEEAFTTAKDALEIARRYGAVTDRMLPWSGALNRGPVDAFFERARAFRIRSFHSLDLKTYRARQRQWRRWMHQHGPVLLVVEADRTFIEAGAEPVADFDPLGTPFLHACALVGYDDGGYLIRNSWGRRWGDRGDAYVTAGWLERAVQETYGVVV